MDKNETGGKKAVVLFSGGLDSSTTLKIALDEGFGVIPLTFFYNQRHAVEVDRARDIAAFFKLGKHTVVNLDFGNIKGSALTDSLMEVPKNSLSENAQDIPSTYVPARNTIFLSYALAVAEVNGAEAIFIGANHIDYSGYPDCRPEYLSAFENMANLATKASVSGSVKFSIMAPLLRLSKKEIIIKASSIGVPLELTHSCYDPVSGLACGTCDSCLLRKKGFEDAGISDPTKYYGQTAFKSR